MVYRKRIHAGSLVGLAAALLLSVAWAEQSPSQPNAAPAVAAPGEPSALVRADIRLEKNVLQAGQPVWVECCLTNLTPDPLTLHVPDVPVDGSPEEQMGLPLAHVFSGTGFSAISVKDSRGDMLDTQVSLRPGGAIPAVHLAPQGQVGIRLDLTRHYESLLRRPGKYSLIWRPYGGTVESAPVNLTLLAEQQALVLTDQGKMTLRFYYDEAPVHVQNFLELIERRFYDNLTFHRIVPGGIVQGGDPRGDGRGSRPDGKRLQAEFSRIPFEAGTVGMARSPKDPDSASCQFFICLSRQASFDGRQTAFGYLVGDESFATLRKIAAISTDDRDRPRTPVYIRAISLENVPARDRELASLAAVGKPAVASPAVAATGKQQEPVTSAPATAPAIASPAMAVPATQPTAWENSRTFDLRRTMVKGAVVQANATSRPATAVKGMVVYGPMISRPAGTVVRAAESIVRANVIYVPPAEPALRHTRAPHGR